MIAHDPSSGTPMSSVAVYTIITRNMVSENRRMRAAPLRYGVRGRGGAAPTPAAKITSICRRSSRVDHQMGAGAKAGLSLAR